MNFDAMTNRELLRYMDRSLPEVRILCERLEELLSMGGDALEDKAEGLINEDT